MDGWIETYYKELSFAIVEAEKPYDQPFVNWRPKKAKVIQSDAEGQRTREPMV